MSLTLCGRFWPRFEPMAMAFRIGHDEFWAVSRFVGYCEFIEFSNSNFYSTTWPTTRSSSKLMKGCNWTQNSRSLRLVTYDKLVVLRRCQLRSPDREQLQPSLRICSTWVVWLGPYRSFAEYCDKPPINWYKSTVINI